MRTRSIRNVGLVLFTAALVVVTATGCRSIFGRGKGPVDAIALMNLDNPALNATVQGVINERPEPKTVELVVPPGTRVTNLVLTMTLNTQATVTVISTGQRVVQQNGATPNDFSAPVTYSVEVPGQEEPWLYVVTVREAGTNAQLADLSIADSVFQTPSFSPTRKAYEIEVLYATEEVRLAARAVDGRAFAITIDGQRVGANQGSATIDFFRQESREVVVEVVAEDQETTEEYLVVIIRGEPDRNSNLAALEVAGSPLEQTFRRDRKSYTALAPYSADRIGIIAVPDSAFAMAEIDGIIANKEGMIEVYFEASSKQLYDVIVTAEDGSTSIYTLTVVRAEPDSNVDLAGINLSTGTLSPRFTPATVTYSVVVPEEQTAISIVVEAESPVSEVEISGDGAAKSSEIARNAEQIEFEVLEGEQYIVVATVTAESGVSRDYRFAVRRDVGVAATALESLRLVDLPMEPAFDPEVTSYKSSAPYDVDTAFIVASTKDVVAELTIDGREVPNVNGAASVLLFPSITNYIELVVRATDGNERLYTIQIQRAAPVARTARRVISVEMDELLVSRNIASNLNSNRSDLEAEARIRVRYVGDEEIIYEGFAEIETEKARNNITISMEYQTDFISVDRNRFLEVEIAIPTTGDRYLHYSEIIPAGGTLEVRPRFVMLSDESRVMWPQPGEPRPVSARVQYSTSPQARTAVEDLDDAFKLNSSGEYEIELSLIDLDTGRRIGTEVIRAKPASQHGRTVGFADGLEFDEGQKIGYILTAETEGGRLLRDHGVAEVRTVETFDDGGWDFATLVIEAEMDLVDEGR